MKHILIILIAFFSSLATMGQEMYVDIETTNPSPGVGDKFKISYILKLRLTGGVASVSHNGIKIATPNFDEGFVVLEEGTERTSFGFGSLGGGDMEISKYSFILQAKKKGTFKIEPFVFVINGKKIKSGVFTINVGKGNPNVKVQSSDPNLFARIEVSKRNVYKGEALTVVYKVYTRYRGFGINDYEMPMTNGFWKEEIKSGKNGWKQTTQTVNGMPYNVITLKKEVVIPQITGDIKLKPMEITAEIGRSFWGAGQTKKVTSNSPTIKVKPLPKPIPNDFSNQVGSNYRLKVTYSTNQLKTNEALDIKVEISGKGNINQLTTPNLKLPQDFELFDPEVKENIKVSTSGISGKKTYNFLAIPRYRGTFELPAITFTYFDIKAKKYKTLKSEPKKILVEKGNDNGTVTTSHLTPAEKKDVEILNEGIRHIKEKTKLFAKKDALYGKPIYWTGIFAPILAVLLYYIILVLTKNGATNDLISRRKKANKQATNRLKKSAQFLKENKTKEFYAELYKALYNYISHKFSLPVSQLTKESIEKTLAENKVEKETIDALIKILNECEMARFSPTTQTGAEETLKNATEIIQKIERNVKK